MKIILLITALLLALNAHAEYLTAQGTITTLRTSSAYHYVSEADGVTIFQLSNPISSKCRWLGIEKTDKSSLSFLMTAYSLKQNIKVWYYDHKTNDVWSSVCQAYTFELK